MTIPNKSPFLSFYSPRRDSRYKRGRPNFLPFQWGIFALILEAWIKGYVKSSFLLLCTHSHTTMPTTYYSPTFMYSLLTTCACAPTSHSYFSLTTVYTLAPLHFPYSLLFLFTFSQCACANFPYSYFSVPHDFLVILENLHDIPPHQTTHLPVCAKKGEEVRFWERRSIGYLHVPVDLSPI